MGAEWALQSALVSALKDDAGLAGVLGDPPRIFDLPPDDAVFPYVSLGPSASNLLDGDGTPGVAHTVHLHVWSRYGGAKEAKTCLEALRVAVDQASLSLIDHHLVSLRPVYADVLRVGDGRTFRGVLRLRAVTQAAA